MTLAIPVPTASSPDALDAAADWFGCGQRFALATVVDASGSAPLPVGTTMAIGPDGQAVGSVSGGCIDGAVYETSLAVRDSGVPQIEVFSSSTGDLFQVATPCGGTLTVLIEAVSPQSFPQFGQIVASRRQRTPIAWATAVSSGTTAHAARVIVDSEDSSSGSLGNEQLDGELLACLADMRSERESLRYIQIGQWNVVLRLPGTVRSQLLVFGATEHAAALCGLAASLGFRVTVCDARPIFATAQRFPGAESVVCDWPPRYLENTAVEASTAICVLTHDEKFDVPLLLAALRTNAGYIGAIGSRRTHRDRQERLLAAGATAKQLARVRSPIGLDLGGRSAHETALSILAEIVMVRTGRTGAPLHRLTSPLH